MKNKKIILGSACGGFVSLTLAWLAGCGPSPSGKLNTSNSSSSGSCTVTNNTTETSTANSYGCKLLTRDVSSCQASRTAQGLTGYWLKFSCRVTLTKSGSNVVIATDSQPEYKSPYFGSTHACYEAQSISGRSNNPNKISAQSLSVTVPATGTAGSSTTAMSMGYIGVALDGVGIFSNAAAPGDDIYTEVATFDKCEAHPDVNSKYHYHIEPPSISNQDSNFVGVMRDGFPIYGRYDSGSTTAPTLDSAGGHTGTTVDSTTAVYHYHVGLQTSGSNSAYFITTGYYKGTAGSCTGCL